MPHLRTILPQDWEPCSQFCLIGHFSLPSPSHLWLYSCPWWTCTSRWCQLICQPGSDTSSQSFVKEGSLWDWAELRCRSECERLKNISDWWGRSKGEVRLKSWLSLLPPEFVEEGLHSSQEPRGQDDLMGPGGLSPFCDFMKVSQICFPPFCCDLGLSLLSCLLIPVLDQSRGVPSCAVYCPLQSCLWW